jgi:hypothetical protein
MYSVVYKYLHYIIYAYNLKGLCNEMNIVLKAYSNKQVLQVQALIVFFLNFLILRSQSSSIAPL